MSKTVNDGFEKFLTWLQPLSSEHSKSISHKDSVKSCLENNFDCSNFFETGSFGAGTGVRHYSDTDYFAVIPTKYLHNDSSEDLTIIKKALQFRFPHTNVSVNSPAVNLPFGTYASETLEVTPCCFNGISDTPVGKFGSYEIPDSSSGWMFSSPQAHNAYVNKVNNKLNGKLKPLIQLVKAWKYYNNVPLISFYIELRVTKYAEGESSIVYDIDLKRIFKQLSEIELADMRDPMGISGLIPASKTNTQKKEALSKVNTALGRAEKALEAKEKIEDAFYYWDLLFNKQFPAY